MRTIPRPQIGRDVPRFRFVTPSTPVSRSYSSLRPPTLIHKSSNNKRPTLLSTSAKAALSHHHNHQRPFSLLPLVDSSVAASQTLLTTLHTATVTPWYLTIPLFAAALSLTARLPTTVYVRRLAVRRARLAPLSAAWAARARADAGAGPNARDPERWAAESARGAARARREMERRWGVQAWKNYAPALAVFPIWLMGIEGLRRMCGGPLGLLGSMLFGWKKGGTTDAAGQGLGHAPEGGLGSGLGAIDSTSLATAQETVTRYVADHSFATGGCLWFPDLTAADPYHILPFALSAILVWNMLPKSQAGFRTLFGLDNAPAAVAVQSEVKWPLRLQRGLLMVALAAGPLTMDLPAALHLYWISSAVMTSAQTAIIAKIMPLPRTVPPARGQDTFLIQPTREDTR
ncbi:hypothetical protein P885DRAFT_35964 [Corynascus similis CBS 632.67]